MTPATIDSLEQWRLLVGVCPLFERGLPWTSRIEREADKLVIANTADLLKNDLKALGVIVPVGAVLIKDKYDEVVHQINSLLFTLETLLQNSIKESLGLSQASGIFESDESSSFANYIIERYPKLVELYKLVQSCNVAGFVTDLNQFVRLEQDAGVFKEVGYSVKAFVKTVEAAIERPSFCLSPPTQPNRAQSRISEISHSLQDHSRRLFTSLITHIGPCVSGQSKHEAMLQLKHLEHRGDPLLKPQLSMLLASCPDQKHWQHTQCSIFQEEEEDDDYMETNPVIELGNICHHAQIAYGNEQIFRIQLVGGRFFDASDDSLQLDNPGLVPTVSLLHLMDKGMFKDRYKFFPNDKRILAYTLAHALLSLYESDWLQRLWTLENIYLSFAKDTNMVYNIHQPYIACILSADRPPLGTLDPLHRFPLILAFAKLLWEIETGEKVHATRTYKTGNVSLWYTLKESCDRHAKDQLSSGYRKALEACLYFPKYLARETKKDDKVTVQHVILKYIVQELESEVDLADRSEWGKRSLSLDSYNKVGTPRDSQRSASHSSTDFNGCSDVPSTATPSRQTASNTGVASPSRKRPTSNVRALPTTGKVASQTRAMRQAVGSHGATRLPPAEGASGVMPTPKHPPSRPNSSAQNTPPPKRVTLNNPKVAQKSRQRAEPAKRIQKTDSSTPSLSPQRAHVISQTTIDQTDNLSANDGHQHHSNQQTGYNALTVQSGFGYTQLLSLTDAKVQISSETFNYLNKTVDEYWQHWAKDVPVKIAILDSGFDLEHADFKLARTKTFTGPHRNTPTPAEDETIQKDRVIAWRNFCPDQEATDISDIDGHGTQVAGIILRLAPHVQLYIARICAGDANRGLPPERQVKVEKKNYHTPQPELVEKAIEWALENKVDIINLSMGFRNYSETALEGLRSALEKATEQKVVVFAATSNDGLHEQVAWPARDRQYALGVHSCGDSGRKPSDFNAEPSSHGENFMVVGENILSHWPTKKDGGFRIATGTSFSTPVASAIGALVLQFVRQRRCKQHSQRVGGIVRLEDLCTNVGMGKVLRMISRDVAGEFWSISPKLFWRDTLPTGRDPIQHAWDIIEIALKAS